MRKSIDAAMSVLEGDEVGGVIMFETLLQNCRLTHSLLEPLLALDPFDHMLDGMLNHHNHANLSSGRLPNLD